MSDVRPRYMDTFRCIGPDCEFSCCRYWDIAVDAQSAKNYRRGKTEANGHLVSNVIHRNPKGALVMAMTEANECPMLRQDGLCDLHARHGEGAIPSLCQTYPRDKVPRVTCTELHGRLSCPEVARKLLTDPDALLPAGDGAAILEKAAAEVRAIDPTVVLAAEQLMEAMLTDRSKPLWCRLLDLAYLVNMMETSGAHTPQEAIPALEIVADQVAHGTFDAKWQETPVGPHEQIVMLGESLSRLIRLKNPHPAVKEAWDGFLDLDRDQKPDLCASTYTQAFRNSVKPFLDSRPHMLENLVIAQTRTLGLPRLFGKGGSRVTTLCTLYAHVVGIFTLLTFRRGAAVEEDFIKAVTVTFRHVFHNTAFQQRIADNNIPDPDRFLPRLFLLLAEPA